MNKTKHRKSYRHLEQKQKQPHCKITQITTRKLSNTNANTDEKNLSVNYSEIYRHNISLLFPLVYTNKKITLVFTKRITV